VRRIPFSARLGGAALALVAFLAFSWLLAPRTVDLTLQLPADAAPVSTLDLRVVDVDEGADTYRGRRTRPQPGRSMLFQIKLARGRYRLTATTPGGQVYEAVVDHGHEDFLEVPLAAR